MKEESPVQNKSGFSSQIKFSSQKKNPKTAGQGQENLANDHRIALTRG